MKIRFQADNDLHEDILRATKRLQPAIDFQRAPELNLYTGIKDPEVIRLCAKENRLLVTHDCHTMPGHFIEFIKNQDSPGIFIISRRLSSVKRLSGWRYFGKQAKLRNTEIRSSIFHNEFLNYHQRRSTVRQEWDKTFRKLCLNSRRKSVAKACK
jgi:hypothetical protein